ncbi:hypothetical protein HEP81_01073 [Streptomyces griseofuscus]|uniref:Uncharacterized protein n=1 Tax=Streptomyces griseofuscus TaxID=146922 RepID=A0A7H1PTM7_9ACTN|nr:hypothetical protein HEP81_01073 [Streptomyces griseofuscus]
MLRRARYSDGGIRDRPPSMCRDLRRREVYRPCRSKWMDVNTATLARRAQGSKGLLM